MRILFLCNTLYQVIVASCIRMMYEKAEADLILSDHSVGNEKLVERFHKTNGIFSRVFYTKTKYLFELSNSSSVIRRIKNQRDRKLVSQLVGENKYDMFFCANDEPYSRKVVSYVKHFNDKAEINWFEDGITAYDFDKRYFIKVNGLVRIFVKRLLGIYDVTHYVNNYYVFRPENMEWNPPAALKRIEPMSGELAQFLALVFDFDNCVDRYNEKYIFFEDGAMDWNSKADIEMVQKISDIVGKENIFIKIHPRNSVNRFKELGYKTSKDLSVPWEIVAANIDIEKKILITMYSQCVITPEVLLGRNGKCIVLGEMEGYGDKVGKEVFNFVEKHYFNQNSSNYATPKNINELVRVINDVNSKNNI